MRTLIDFEQPVDTSAPLLCDRTREGKFAAYAQYRCHGERGERLQLLLNRAPFNGAPLYKTQFNGAPLYKTPFKKMVFAIKKLMLHALQLSEMDAACVPAL